MSEQKWTREPWSQGQFLDLRQYAKASPVWKKARQEEEERCVFAFFRAEDQGRSRVPVSLAPHQIIQEEAKANAARIVSCVNALSGIADPETWVTMCKELTAFMSRASTENNDDPVRLLIRAIHAAEGKK